MNKRSERIVLGALLGLSVCLAASRGAFAAVAQSPALVRAEGPEALAQRGQALLPGAEKVVQTLVRKTDDQALVLRMKEILAGLEKDMENASWKRDQKRLEGTAKEFQGKLDELLADALSASPESPQLYKVVTFNRAEQGRLIWESYEYYQGYYDSWCAARKNRKEALRAPEEAFQWVLRNRRFATLRHRVLAGDPGLAYADAQTNQFLLDIVDKRAGKDPVRRRQMGVFVEGDGAAVFSYEEAKLYLAEAGFLNAEGLPASVEGLDTKALLDFLSKHFTTGMGGIRAFDLSRASGSEPLYDLPKLRSWVERHRPALELAHRSEGGLVYCHSEIRQPWGNVVRTLHNGDLLSAIDKLAAERGLTREKLAFTSPADSSVFLLHMEQALDIFRQAHGSVVEAELPQALHGIRLGQALMLMKDWLGEEAFEKFQYRMTGPKGETINLYNLPMLDLWVTRNLVDLQRVLNDGWAAMPLEKAVLWAVQEQAATEAIPVTNILTATPNGFYIHPPHYPQVMRIFRENKRTLANEELAKAIGQFRAELIAELGGIRQALGGLDSRRQLEMIAHAINGSGREVSAQIASMRNAVNLQTFVNILLHAFN